MEVVVHIPIVLEAFFATLVSLNPHPSMSWSTLFFFLFSHGNVHRSFVVHFDDMSYNNVEIISSE